MNSAPCFLPVGLSLKRRSMVFILAMAAIYAVRPGVARADFTMQYTGAPFNQNTFNCGVTTDPFVACLGGRLTMSFVVQGDPPTSPGNFCLSLTVIGQPEGNCLTVSSGTINAGGVNIPLVGSLGDMSTFHLSGGGINLWNVLLEGLSSADPSTILTTGKTPDLAGDGVNIFNPSGSTPSETRSFGANTVAGAWAILSGTGQGTPVGQEPPFGADAQLFGILANGALTLARDTQVNMVRQSGAVPIVGAETATIAGPRSYLAGDLVASDASGRAISLGGDVKVAGQCVTAGGSVMTTGDHDCGSIDTTGSSAALTAFDDAPVEAKTYAGFLAGLAPTKTLGDVKLQKFQSLTLKLGPGLNVVSIGNLVTDGVNFINVSAPSGAVVVFNISGTIQLGTQTRVIAEANGLNPENLIWNVRGANPIFGESAAFDGTLLNFPTAETTVTIGAGSLINGAVLTNGSLMVNGAMRLNFWPFSGTLTTTR